MGNIRSKNGISKMIDDFSNHPNPKPLGCRRGRRDSNPRKSKAIRYVNRTAERSTSSYLSPCIHTYFRRVHARLWKTKPYKKLYLNFLISSIVKQYNLYKPKSEILSYLNKKLVFFYCNKKEPFAKAEKLFKYHKSIVISAFL